MRDAIAALDRCGYKLSGPGHGTCIGCKIVMNKLNIKGVSESCFFGGLCSNMIYIEKEPGKGNLEELKSCVGMIRAHG